MLVTSLPHPMAGEQHELRLCWVPWRCEYCGGLQDRAAAGRCHSWGTRNTASWKHGQERVMSAPVPPAVWKAWVERTQLVRLSDLDCFCSVQDLMLCNAHHLLCHLWLWSRNRSWQPVLMCSIFDIQDVSPVWLWAEICSQALKYMFEVVWRVHLNRDSVALDWKMKRGDDSKLNCYSAVSVVWLLVNFRQPGEDAPGSKGPGPGQVGESVHQKREDGWWVEFVSGYVLMCQMKFSDDKCKIMRAGKTNCNHAFTLIGPNCTIIIHRRALGAIAQSSQKQQRGTRLEEERKIEY